MRPISSSDTARLITDLDTCDTCDAETRDTCTHLVTIVLTGDRRHTKLPTVNHTGAVVTAGRMKPDNRSLIDLFCIVGKQDFASQILI